MEAKCVIGGTLYGRRGIWYASRWHGQRVAQNPSRVSLRGPGKNYDEPYRFTPSIRFPTFDPSNGTLEWGLSCKGCRDGCINRLGGNLN